jgi:YfiH family protein
VKHRFLPGWIEAAGLPASVRAGTATQKFAGVSATPFGPGNFGDRCGDEPAAVSRNRALLYEQLELPSEPLWLRQVHGTQVWTATDDESERTADACIVRASPGVAVVLTADCLPIVLASADGMEIAAIHAGWRGLADGVIEATLAAMQSASNALHAWLGPAISQPAFEVGPEVRAAMLAADPGCAACFIRGRDDRWHADLYALARRRLQAKGVQAISGGGLCTHTDPALHSYRRDGARSGRMATLVWRR